MVLTVHDTDPSHPCCVLDARYSPASLAIMFEARTQCHRTAADMSGNPRRIRLDDLPTEILVLILTSGSCKTALSFQQVNRRCRDVCNDVQVFKGM